MHADGNGLYLLVDATGARRWTFIFRWQGKRTEMGLGRAGEGGLSLADARETVEGARRSIRAGVNPLAARKAAEAAEAAAKVTFGTFADTLVTSLVTGFRNEKHRDQWRMTLSIQKDGEGHFKDGGYCMPLRDKALDAIGTDEVLAVVEPIWLTKPETAHRVRGRIERVLDAAKVKGLRNGENPARWRGHLDKLLPKPKKLARGHHAAMPYADVPALVVRLRESGSMAALATEWTILAAARTGETLGARLSEIDRAAKLWTVPAERMKANRVHRVPMTARMCAIYDHALQFDRGGNNDGYLFPGAKRGKPLSTMAMTMQMRRLKADAFTVHGFRSAFRDWVGEETMYRPDLAEAALAHVVGDATERAYRRKDALEWRREMMAEWADFVDGKSGGEIANAA
jgi:integrase